MQQLTKSEGPLDSASNGASRYVDEDGAAGHLNCKPRLLQSLRSTGGGPRWVRIGRQVRYRLDWLDDWAEANAVTSKVEETERRGTPSILEDE